MATYADSAPRTINQKLGESPSILDFDLTYAQATGAANASAKLQDALDSVALAGTTRGATRALHIPGGVTLRLDDPVSFGGVTLYGDGDQSKIVRGATMPNGYGVFNVTGPDAAFEDLLIDGAVTTTVGLKYGLTGAGGDFSDDPMHVALTRNTSIWIRPGSHRVAARRVSFTHSGGYSMLWDAQNGDIRAGLVEGCRFENIRPHLFGVTAGDLKYGAWTGGVFCKSDARSGKPYAVRGFKAKDNHFRRMNGNCIWSHSYDFVTFHEDFQIEGNSFEYIARDAVMVGAVKGGFCRGNTATWVGFSHLSDSDVPAAAYLGGVYAVGFDAAGWVEDFNFQDNTVREFYGGGIDLDGVRNGNVSGNTLSSSQPVAKGIQTGDSNGNGGAFSVKITSNKITGCNASAVTLKDAENCLCADNLIEARAGGDAPIILYSTIKRTKKTTVTGNKIKWADAAANVIEDDAGTGTGFDATTQNRVHGNEIMGPGWEFQPHSSSTSLTGMQFSSRVGGTTKTATFSYKDGRVQLEDYDFRIGSGNPVYGASFSTGRVTIGTEVGFQTAGYVRLDTFGTHFGIGMLAQAASQANGDVTGLWALADGGGSSAIGTAACIKVQNQLFGTSSMTSGIGLHVMRPALYGSGGVGTFYGIYVDDLNNAGTNWFLYSPHASAGSVHVGKIMLGSTSDDASGAILQITGYANASVGYASPGTSYETFKAPSGGVRASSLRAEKYIQVGQSSGVPTLTTGDALRAGMLYWDTGGTSLKVYDGSAWVALGSGGVSGLTAGRVPYAASGTSLVDTANLTWDNTNKCLTVTTGSGAPGMKVLVGYMDSAQGFLSTYNSFQTVQAPNGGLYGRSLRATAYTSLGQSAGAPSATTGDSLVSGAAYWDTSAAALKVYNGSAWLTPVQTVNSLAGPALSVTNGNAGISVSSSGFTISILNAGVLSLTGTTNQVTVSASTGAVTLSLPQSIHTGATPTFASLTLSASGRALNASTGYIEAAGGFLTNGTNQNIIQAPSGGVMAMAFYISNGVGGWNVAVDASRNHYCAAVKSTAGADWISSSGAFVGAGVACGPNGIGGGGFNPWNGASYDFGQTLASWQIVTDIRDNAGTIEKKTRVVSVRGGVLTAIGSESGWTAI